jgi:hypothetical protein
VAEREQAKKEGVRVMDVIEGDSVIPAGANIMYHIVSIKWYQKWLSYTLQTDSTVTPAQDNSHPGKMNQFEVLEHFLDLSNMNKSVTPRMDRDLTNQMKIKSICKENVHYKVLPHEAWKILNLRYGMDSMYQVKQGMTAPPADLVCLSVAVPTADPEKPEYLVEVN